MVNNLRCSCSVLAGFSQGIERLTLESAQLGLCAATFCLLHAAASFFLHDTLFSFFFCSSRFCLLVLQLADSFVSCSKTLLNVLAQT